MPVWRSLEWLPLEIQLPLCPRKYVVCVLVGHYEDCEGYTSVTLKKYFGEFLRICGA
jgi:hypothetical protein